MGGRVKLWSCGGEPREGHLIHAPTYVKGIPGTACRQSRPLWLVFVPFGSAMKNEYPCTAKCGKSIPRAGSMCYDCAMKTRGIKRERKIWPESIAKKERRDG